MKGRKEDKSIIEIYKRHMVVIIILISIVVLSILMLLFINLHNNYKENTLVNTLGKQRMLTQIMAKDANRIYQLQSEIGQSKDDKNGIADLKNKLKLTMNDLEHARNTYKNQYESISKGYINIENKEISFGDALPLLNPIMQKHDKIWPNFDSSINVLLKENENTTESIKAVKQINDDNEILLECSDEITSIVFNYNNSRSLKMSYLTIILAIIVLLSLAIFLINAYRTLFMPISQLFKGAEQVGITEIGTISSEINYDDYAPEFYQITTIFDKLNSLILLIENLSRNVPFKHILKYIFDTFIEFIPYTYIGIALISDDKKSVKASYGISGKYHKSLPKRVLGYKVGINGTSLGKIIETGEERIINDLEEYVKDKPLKEYNRILIEEGIKSSITFPLKNDKEVVGIIFFSSNTKNVYSKEHTRFLKTLANSIMLSLEEDILIDDLIISSTLALAMLTEERDIDTGDHLNRMKTYSKIIAELISTEEKFKDIVDIDYINNIERFSPLHDIGKVAIKDDILLKPGRLSDEEFEIMKTHTIYGSKVLKMADENLKKKGRSVFKLGVEIAEGHHEKWDGSGYPYCKKGEEIPLSSRIVAIADVFDALTSKRPYKKAFSFEESVEIILQGSGKHFDPNIVNIFINNIQIIREAYDKFQQQSISLL